MDTSKLPKGSASDTLWRYSHHNSIFHSQLHIGANIEANIDASIETYKDIPVNINVNKSVNTNADKVVTSPVESIIVVSNEEDKPTVSPDNNDHSNSSVQPKNSVNNDIMLFMAAHIDDLYSLYSENMIRDAVQILKDRLVLLLTDGPVPKLFGPKKTRILIGWITNNKRGTPASDEAALIVAEFVAWFLDITITYVPKETDKEKPTTVRRAFAVSSKVNAEFLLYRKRGAWWIKNNDA